MLGLSTPLSFLGVKVSSWALANLIEMYEMHTPLFEAVKRFEPRMARAIYFFIELLVN